ncbi:NAD(+)/NADH kinase [Selenomonas sp. oral taxon 892 str. F0426]|jgi:probable inorganic polyphosphate/ATP-NAD kinase|uniref:NAD(+)/NADH kinase n=1 Tax=Selenomonas sp. oral taxon 892 TaxID=1321785 RepID=UPI0003AD4265|nr:NAD(+)/NADH kinase [Selenomonas sp. oral taxon 892]ERJ92754.1 NAD(+)/NADH kinase [Selenomonas sp. oral taxon 892 str. F0426]
MKTVAVFPNLIKPETRDILTRIRAFFATREARIILPRVRAAEFGMEDCGVDDIERQPADFALSLGGDGTLLGICRRYASNPVPVCGINMGTLGFMADIEQNELEERLEKLCQGDYHVEWRRFLAGYVTQSDGMERFLGYAINDIVVMKGDAARIISLGLAVNDTPLVECKADGFIVASPTGSTAYSLSAGGPIMNPMVRGLLLTPICAHTLNIRPLIIREEDIVHINLIDTRQSIIVTLDGQETTPIHPDNIVTVRCSDVRAGIIKFEDKDYYQILRTKLWRNC